MADPADNPPLFENTPEYLRQRKDALMRQILALFYAEESSYEAFIASENVEERKKVAAQIAEAYRELADVTQELGEREFSASARINARNFTLENEPDYLKHESTAIQQRLNKLIGEKVVSWKSLDLEDEKSKPQLESDIHEMYNTLGQLEEVLNQMWNHQDSQERPEVGTAPLKAIIDEFAERFDIERPQATITTEFSAALASPDGLDQIVHPPQATAAPDTAAAHPPAPAAPAAEAAADNQAPTTPAQGPAAPTANQAPANAQTPPGNAWTFIGTQVPGNVAANALRGAMDASPGIPGMRRHRKTRIPGLDRLQVARQPNFDSQIALQVPYYAAEFKVRQSDLPGQEGVFYLSAADDASGCEVVVTADKFGQMPFEKIKEILSKNKGHIIPLHIVKRHEEDGTPVFVVNYAEPWRDPEKTIETIIRDPKTGNQTSKGVKYNKGVYITLANRRGIQADILATQTRRDLLGMSAGDTARLLEISKTLPFVQKYLTDGNWAPQYSAAIEGMAHSRWGAGQSRETFRATAEQRAQVVVDVYNSLTQGKDYYDLLRSDFPGGRPLTFEYTDANGQVVSESINRIGHNLLYDDDQQVKHSGIVNVRDARRNAIEAALLADSEKLLAFGMHQAIHRSTIAQAAKTSSMVNRMNGERLSILTDVSGPAFKSEKDNWMDFVLYDHHRLAGKGILFQARSVDEDCVVPGYEKKATPGYAQEEIQEKLMHALTKAQERAGAPLLNHEHADDNISKALGHKLAENYEPIEDKETARRRDIDATYERESHLKSIELKRNEAQLIDHVNGVRMGMGLPAIGRSPQADYKAALGVFDFTLGNVVKQFSEFTENLEKGPGWF